MLHPTRSRSKQSGLRAQARSLAVHLEKVARNGALKQPLSASTVAQWLWETLDTPLSLGLSLLVKNGQLEDALAIKFQPGRYLDWDVNSARDDYQAVSIIAKAPVEIPGVDRELAALEKFREAEALCRATNARFRAIRLDPTLITPDVDRVLSIARRKIHRWIGDRPNTSRWLNKCRFGPGADVLNKGDHAQAYNKLSNMSVTADFYDGAQNMVLCQPGWYKNQVMVASPSGVVAMAMRTVPGNKVTFVPKTALTFRSIAIEPGMNIYAQLGLGAILRACLKRVGLDLDNADDNRAFALKGSVTGTIATIDLSMASDTLARELVRELLPELWYVALDWVRSKVGVYSNEVNCAGEVFRYEKFSSMGNGYTFELESMIFYALALACAEVSGNSTLGIRAFGDDITVPTGVVPLLTEVLTHCGFRLNQAKSFSSGVFRESCGMDFFNGVNIRPYFFKEDACGSIQGLYRLANGLRRASYRRNLGYGCDAKLRPVWERVVRRIPRAFRDIVVPATKVTWKSPLLCGVMEVAEVDGGLMSNWHEASVSPLVSFNRDTQAGWLYYSYTSGQRSFTPRDETLYKCCALYLSKDGREVESLTWDKLQVRGEGLPRLRWGLQVPIWQDVGNWM